MSKLKIEYAIVVVIALNIGLFFLVARHYSDDDDAAAAPVVIMSSTTTEPPTPANHDNKTESITVEPGKGETGAREPISDDDVNGLLPMVMEFGVAVEPCGVFRNPNAKLAWKAAGEVATLATANPTELGEHHPEAILNLPTEPLLVALAEYEPVVTLTFCQSPTAIFEVQFPVSQGWWVWLVEGWWSNESGFNLTAVRFIAELLDS